MRRDRQTSFDTPIDGTVSRHESCAASGRTRLSLIIDLVTLTYATLSISLSTCLIKEYDLIDLKVDASHITQNSGSFGGNVANVFKCPHCIFVDNNESALAEHLQVFHAVPILDSVEAGYRCQFCHSVFLRHDRLLHHLQKHVGTGGHKCFLCAKKYSTQAHLVRHIKTTHSRVGSFACHLCPSEFSRKDSLHTHIRKNHMQLAKR
ncbi:hypothetical protein HPB51_004807 [Rhipicephalus microplus]|uniref:C2H2-type domain-containing protein n=1 Tax=Rhipicephalus microplus TaxID=6941 RepID=A0A9J6E6A8_RHIMP|nr:hypothetical protein HPB51_004807 [Rhipicephalus microplus]